MAWDNAKSFAKTANVAMARIPKTMPEAMRVEFNFGKWSGATVSNVLRYDPSYMLYLLKKPNPGNPFYEAARIVEVIAKRALAELDAIGRMPSSDTMDELWSDAVMESEHGDWGCRDYDASGRLSWYPLR